MNRAPAVVALLLPAVAFAEERASTKEAEGIVHNAVAFLKKEGKEQGKFWQEYQFMNPATKKIEQKVAYCEVLEGVILCSGAYKP